jgi:hypothetical protein
MNELLEAIRAAVAEQATAEHKAAGAQACRTILAALEAEPGKPLGGPAAAAQPLAGLDATQALDLLIARLRAALPKDGDERAARPADRPGLRIALVTPPPGVPWRKR